MSPDQLLFMRPVRGYADYRTPVAGPLSVRRGHASRRRRHRRERTQRGARGAPRCAQEVVIDRGSAKEGVHGKERRRRRRTRGARPPEVLADGHARHRRHRGRVQPGRQHGGASGGARTCRRGSCRSGRWRPAWCRRAPSSPCSPGFSYKTLERGRHGDVGWLLDAADPRWDGRVPGRERDLQDRAQPRARRQQRHPSGNRDRDPGLRLRQAITRLHHDADGGYRCQSSRLFHQHERHRLQLFRFAHAVGHVALV